MIAASSSAGGSQAYRLPAGGDPNAPDAWQRLSDLTLGRQPEVAGGPAGLVAMLEPPGNSPAGLFVQRLVGVDWTPPVQVTGDSLNNDFELAGRRRPAGRAAHRGLLAVPAALRQVRRRRSAVVLGVVRRRLWAVPDLAGGGHGARRARRRGGGLHARGRRADPRRPLPPGAVAGAVQAHRRCAGAGAHGVRRRRPRLVVEARRDGARIRPAAVLRRASFHRARGARRVARPPLQRGLRPHPQPGAHPGALPPPREAGAPASCGCPCGAAAEPGRRRRCSTSTRRTSSRSSASCSCPVLVAALLSGHRVRGHPRRDRVRARELHRRARRLDRAPAQEGDDVRQADGPAGRQAARHLRAGLARLARPARRVGGDGDHRARVRGHRPAPAGDGARRGDPGLELGQAQDLRPDRDGAGADRRSTATTRGSTR